LIKKTRKSFPTVAKWSRFHMHTTSREYEYKTHLNERLFTISRHAPFMCHSKTCVNHVLANVTSSFLFGGEHS